MSIWLSVWMILWHGLFAQSIPFPGPGMVHSVSTGISEINAQTFQGTFTSHNFTFNVAAGDLLICGEFENGTATIGDMLAPTTSDSETFSAINSQLNQSSGSDAAKAWGLQNASANASKTVTVNFTANPTSMIGSCIQFRGAKPSSAIDVAVASDNFSPTPTPTFPSTAGSAGTFTPIETGEAGLIFAVRAASATSWTAGTIGGIASTVVASATSPLATALAYSLSIPVAAESGTITSSNNVWGLLITIRKQ